MALYEVYELIGEGSFGRVYRAQCNRTNSQVAYKVISKNGRSLPEVHALRKECEIQKSLWHPNIIRMLHSFENDEELVVITEFAQQDLCHILKEEGVLGETRARKVVCDLVSALYYLHSNRILHRDLKPQNVLLDCRGNAKLCDFGFAKVLCKDSQMLTSIKGTPLYMAPELMQEHPYDHNADLWSLGCITYELVTGRPPYTTSSIMQLIKMVKIQPITWPHYLSETCLSFLKGLLDKNPACRLTWPYLLYHEFIFSDGPRYLNRTATVQFPDSANVMLNQPVTIGEFDMRSYQNWCLSGNLAPTHQTHVPSTAQNDDCNNDKYIPSHIIEIKDRHTQDSHNSNVGVSQTRMEHSTLDPSEQAEKEEWLESLKKTAANLMYKADIEELIEKHSLMLIINTLNTYRTCPIITTTVARLLSLPFVVESITETQLSQIKKTYASCYVIRHLLHAVENLTSLGKRRLNFNQEVALQQILLLVCHLVFTDRAQLQQFFNSCVSLKLFNNMKWFLSLRTKNDPLSVVKYIISIFTRLYVVMPRSHQFVLRTFENCGGEFRSLLHETEDVKMHSQLYTFLVVLCCYGSNDNMHLSPDMNTLIDSLNQFNMNSNTSTTQQVPFR